MITEISDAEKEPFRLPFYRLEQVKKRGKNFTGQWFANEFLSVSVIRDVASLLSLLLRQM